MATENPEMGESSPLNPSKSGNNPTSTFTHFDEEIPSAAKSSWTRWSKSTRAGVLVVGCALVIIGVFLIASLPGSWSQDGDEDKNLLGLGQAAGENFGIVLEIPQGQLKWSVLKSRENREYFAFFKVPYAQPPIGDLRFSSPQPPEPWEGIRHEDKVAPQCLQKIKYSPIIEAGGEEDCLYANIYTPKLPGINLDEGEELLPVLFYIHGGGFTDGNGSRYGGKYFMDEDAVMVTFQYRLGIFGFLSSEDGTITGNMGMKDQVQALKWVKENIKYFGGDHNRVMIFGNSVGGVSVNQLMGSPMAAGLYQRAITQSGISFGTAMIKTREEQLKSFETLAQEIGCLSRTGNERRRSKRVLKCLREQNASDIAVIRGDGILFATTIERYESEDDKDKFLPDTLYNMYRYRRVNKVPWLIGVNNAEWIHLAAVILTDLGEVQELNTNWTLKVPTIFDSSYSNSTVKDEISTKLREFYFGSEPVSNATLRNLTNMLSDREIIHNSKTEAELMVNLGISPVFLYYMSKRPQKSYSDKALKDYPPGEYGAAHADELQYFFDYANYPEYLQGSEYYEFSKSLVKIWVQFAKTGKPGWDSITPGGEKPLPWYELNDKPGYTTVLEERMAFWDQFTHEELCYTQ